MLSISKMSGVGQGDYYLTLSKEDYYLAGGEPPGIWYGKGKDTLGIEDTVSGDDLRHILGGYSPDGKTPLTKNAGKENRQSGWDLTFSAPKTVSVFWSQSDGKIRKAIEEAHNESVKTALNYLEDESAFTRRGKGGERKEPVSLIVATFEHGTSRAQDPQLHTHALISNIGIRNDGSTGTIESMPLYKSKMAIGALYRAELSKRIEKDPRLQFKTKRVKSWFEIEGVNKDLVDNFSKRRKEILLELEKKGFSGVKAADIATLNTRKVKDNIPREKLFSNWKKIGNEYGFSIDTLPKKENSLEKSPEITPEIRNKAFNSAVTKITEHQSYFSRRDLIRHIAEDAQGKGIGADDVFKSIKDNIQSKDIIFLGSMENQKHYTTTEMLKLEKNLLKNVSDSKEKSFIKVGDKTLEKVFLERPTISKEQKEAVLHATNKKGGIKVISGMAGTGKSYMLSAVNDAYKRKGVKVYGAALSGKAAEGLEEGTGIKSDTIHKTLSEIEKGNIRLNSRTALIIDEAGMVGTRQMEKLVSLSQKNGTRLILVGDSKQLQPIAAGGAFKAISDELGEVRLKDIKRQKDDWAKRAVHKFASGRAADGLKDYFNRGQLFIASNEEESKKELIKTWNVRGGVKSPDKHLIIAGSNLEVSILNEKAQEKRFIAKKLGSDSIKIKGENIFSGDRVVFTRNSRRYGVKNGQIGTVKSLNPDTKSLSITLDNKKEVQIDISSYEHLKLGYAVTTHKAQGVTTENAYILAGGVMQDRELSYVQMSRSKDKTLIFTDELEAGEELKELSKKMSKSRQKDTSLQFIKKMRPTL